MPESVTPAPDIASANSTIPVTDSAPAVDPAPAPTTVVTAPDKDGKPVVEPVAKADDKAPDDGKKELEGAPETYETFTLPEGVEMVPAQLETFLPMAKAMKLTQEQAQQLVDFSFKTQQEAETKAEEAWGNVQTEWLDQAKGDTEIGGEKFDESVADAKIFIKAFGTSELIDMLNSTGVGNHYEILRVFSRAGKAVRGDNLHVGGANSGTPKTQADVIFPNQEAAAFTSVS